MESTPFLNKQTMNQNLLRAENSVVGLMGLTAAKFRKELADGTGNHPFKEVFLANIGNPQVLGQPPITFYRQVLSVLMCPELLKTNVFPEGVLKRAKYYLDKIPGGLGAYGPAPGLVFVRENIAKYLSDRDGVASHADHIQMVDGTASAVADVISAHINSQKDGIMVPVPQYPLYSGNIAYFGGSSVKYYLDEENGWQISVKHLEEVYEEAAKNGVTVRMLVVINPGNPAGQILTQETQEEIIKFCTKRGISLFADEVYQDNDWTNSWIPFRRIVGKMDSPYNKQAVYSIQSTSKGWYGECGLRGGYVEFLNIDPDVEVNIKKIETLPLSCNTTGQVVSDMIIRPPTEEVEGKEVVEQYLAEKEKVLSTLKRNSELATEYFNKMKNVSLVPCVGAMYVFPQVKLSKKVEEEAKKLGWTADLFYTMEGLKATGMVMVEGSAFGQKSGTYHFRSTILIRPNEKFENVLKAYTKFNDEFHEKYAD